MWAAAEKKGQIQAQISSCVILLPVASLVASGWRSNQSQWLYRRRRASPGREWGMSMGQTALLPCKLWHVAGGSGARHGSTLPSSKKKNKNLSFGSFVLGLSGWEGSCTLGRVWKPSGERREDWGFRAAVCWPCLGRSMPGPRAPSPLNFFLTSVANCKRNAEAQASSSASVNYLAKLASKKMHQLQTGNLIARLQLVSAVHPWALPR